MSIFFDFDGTIVDVSRRYYEVHCASLRGSPVLSSEAYWQLKRERTPEVDILREQYPSEKFDDYRATRMALLEDPRFLQHDTLLPGAVETLAILSAQHELFLITLRRKSHHLLEEVDRLGLQSFFREILVGTPEPSPAVAKRMLLEERRAKGQWIVGDTEADIEAGKALGMTTCAVCSGIRTPSFLTSLEPDHLVGDLRELPSLMHPSA